MVFSKESFLRSTSGRRVKHLLADHLDVLDGLPVSPGAFGRVDYSVAGEAYTLYPVMPEWCAPASHKQLTLFVTGGETT